MKLIPGSQVADILRAIVSRPAATMKETQEVVQGSGHAFCTQTHIKNTMAKYCVKRVRYQGNHYKYLIPQRVINAVDALNSGAPSVEKTRVDRVHTPEMKQAPHMRMFYFHADRMRVG